MSSGIAETPGFSCSNSNDVVEKTICGSQVLMKADHDLSDAYAAAVQLGAAPPELLKTDQLQWLAERDDDAWQFLSDQESAKDGVEKPLMTSYQTRIEFLHSLAEKREPASAAMKTIFSTLSASYQQDRRWSSPAMSMLEALARHDTSISLAETLELKKSPQDLPVKPSPELQARLGTDTYHDSEDLLWLPEAGFGGVRYIEGSMRCEDYVLFAKDPEGVGQVVPMPDVLNYNCWYSSGKLALIGEHVTAISEAGTITEVNMDLQSWQDGRWSDTSALQIRFTQQLSPGEGGCVQGDCRSVIVLAEKLVARYSKRPLPGMLDTGLSADEAPTLEKMRRLASDDESMKSLPDFGHNKGAMLDFGTEAVYFLAKLDGKPVLGRIGHGHVGWRSNEDWVVGFWRPTPTKLSPIAGVVVESRRGSYLFAATMPKAPAAPK